MNIEALFDASYDRVIGEGIGITERGELFFRHFYEVFFSASAVIPEIFKSADMDEQVRMLQKGLYQLISFYLLRTDTISLSKIAKSHNKFNYNIEPALYDLWLDALLRTVAELDPKYESDTALAWQIVLTPGILYMKHHYQKV